LPTLLDLRWLGRLDASGIDLDNPPGFIGADGM
jgi:hypothetical protein